MILVNKTVLKIPKFGWITSREYHNIPRLEHSL